MPTLKNLLNQGYQSDNDMANLILAVDTTLL